MDARLNELGAYLADRLGGAVTGRQVVLGELTIEVERERLVAMIQAAASAA